MSRIAVVILNYNGEHHLRQFLPSVLKYSKDARIIVADNHSTDGSCETLKKSFPKVQLISLSENYGYAGGYNQALKQIEAEYYLLLNSDVEVTKDWISPLVDYLDNHSNCAAVQPKILDFKNKDRFEYAGAAGGFIDSLGYPYCRGRIFDTIEQDLGQYDDEKEVFWVSGACFMIRSNSFHSVGGFDDSFFAHMEEIDLCWRLQNMGQKLGYTSKSVVYHLGGGTLNKSSPRKTYLNFRNNLIMLAKNLPVSQLALILPLRILLDLIASLKFWKDFSFLHFKAIIKAEIHFLSHIGHYNRKEIKVRNHHNPITSILLHYYFKKKKTF